MGSIELKCEKDEVTIIRLDKSKIGFLTLSDIIDSASKDVLSYDPDLYEVGESLTIKCYTPEDAQRFSDRLKEDLKLYLTIEVSTQTAVDLPEEEKKEELPA